MSTKSTLAYGDSFHFYEEVLDEHYVYLELQGVNYEAGYNRVMVPIPIHIWEVIRKHGAPDLSLVDKTDEEQQNPSALNNYFGSLAYGAASDPRSEQIQRGIEYYQARRRDQQEIKAAINALEAKNSR